MDARIFNIQKYSIYDGPGIRTLVFFQGCPLRCLWCSNPEGKSPRTRIMWSQTLCVNCGQCVQVCAKSCHGQEHSPARHTFRPEACESCGQCVDACNQGALEISGSLWEIDKILEEALKDKVFYDVSGGGVTLGGGEPLMQPQAAMELLRGAKNAGIHTAMETCGHAQPGNLAQVAPWVDVFLYDMKHTDAEKHKELTGQDNRLILRNLTWLLDTDKHVRLRMPLINGCNANLEEMKKRRDFLKTWIGKSNFLGVDLLPYHKLGIHKYAQLGEHYTLNADAAVGDDFLAEAEAIFVDAGIPVTIVKH